MESPSTKIAELQARLRELHTKQADTLEELTRAIAIKEMWPDAFKHGAVSIRPLTGPIPGLSNLDVLEGVIITQKGKNGPDASRTFQRDELPPVLLEHFKREGDRVRDKRAAGRARRGR